MVHIDVAAALRDEEVAFWDHSCKTRISRSFRDVLRTVSSHPANEPHAVLCHAVSRISIAVSRFRDVFGVCSFVSRCHFVGMSPRESVHDADCELFHL